MGIERTDLWLKEDFENPTAICKRLLPYFYKEEDPNNIYNYLLKFGMYRPGRGTFHTYNELKKQDAWKKVEVIYRKYKKEWSGPEIPIFIFPFQSNNAFQLRRGENKSGVSFKDKMFLFLTPLEDEKEMEALFVHEYHHVCRMHNTKKDIKKYTLLDSVILEGLAEHAVKEYCGEAYQAKWCQYFSKKEIFKKWKPFFDEHKLTQRNDPLHDQLLFGGGSYPRMLGYALGYQIIKQYESKKNFSAKISLRIPASDFLENSS